MPFGQATYFKYIITLYVGPNLFQTFYDNYNVSRINHTQNLAIHLTIQII